MQSKSEREEANANSVEHDMDEYGFMEKVNKKRDDQNPWI